MGVLRHNAVAFTMVVCCINAVTPQCSQDNARRCKVRDQDADTFSLLQAKSRPQLTHKAHAGLTVDPGGKREIQAKEKAHVARMPEDLASATAGTKSGVRSFFGRSTVWAMPVALTSGGCVLMGCLSICSALYSYFTDRSRNAAQARAFLRLSSVLCCFGRAPSGEGSVEEQQQRYREEAAKRAMVGKSHAGRQRTDMGRQPSSRGSINALHQSPQREDVPPLCPKLLPASECRFAVLHDQIRNAGPDAALTLNGLSGKPLLCLSIRGGARLDVELPQPGSEVRCSVLVPADAASHFEIRGARDAPYGIIQARTQNLQEVVVEGKTVLTVEGSVANFKFSVHSATGKPVALARVNNEDYLGGQHFEIRTLPGSDAILAVAVVMAIAVFTTE